MTMKQAKRWGLVTLFLTGAALAVSREAFDGGVFAGVALMLPLAVDVWGWERDRA